MSSNQNSEDAIRKAMVEADVVDVMVALPPQLFFNTQILACLWFLARDKSASNPSPASGRGAGERESGGTGRRQRDRRGEVLFIDARKLGHMETRANRVFGDEDVARIAAMMKGVTEDAVEQAMLEWLAELGWSVAHGPDLPA